MLHRIFSRARTRCIVADTSGSVAIVAAVVMIAVLGVGGLAVDYARAINSRSSMQAAVDAAALAASSMLFAGESESDAEAAAHDAFEANFQGSKLAERPTVGIQITTDGNGFNVAVSADAAVPTTLLKIVNVNEMATHTEASSYTALPRDEVTFVMDVSWSMRQNDRLVRLQAAVRAFIDTLKPYDRGSAYRVVTLIPYTESVHLGTDHADWLGAETADAPHSDFVGCFRPEPEEAIVSSAVSSFGPGEMLAFKSEIMTGDPTCPPAGSKAIFHSPDSDALKDLVEGLEHGFGTATDIAVSWGWRSLTPAWRGTFKGAASFPKDFSAGNNKIMIVLTDGRPRRADISGDGRGEAVSRGERGCSGVELSLDIFKEICRQIKLEGQVTVYTIGYDVDSAESEMQGALSGCVTKDGRHFDSNPSDIESALNFIAGKIAQVRLTH